MMCRREENRRTILPVLFAVGMMLIFSMLFARDAKAAAYKESDYSLVYDYNYYIARYPYVKTKCKTRAAVLKRFVEVGMKNGAQGSVKFNPKVYRANYPDLKSKYGNNWKQYYLHYIRTGKKEGRLARASVKTYTKFKLKIDPNGGTYKGSTAVQYRYRKYGTVLTLPKPKKTGYTFSGWKLTGKGKLNGSKFTFTRTTLGTTKLTAQWKKKNTATTAKVENMVKFAISKEGKGGSEVWSYWGFVENWCCMFVTYCADKGGGLVDANVEDSWGSGKLPKCAGQRDLARLLKARGQLKFSSSGYIPKRGDLIFFVRSGMSRTTNIESFSHVGIVTGCSGDTVYTVEGNTVTWDLHTSKVAQKSYDIDADRICAYGQIK